jgi:PBP superfamily domain
MKEETLNSIRFRATAAVAGAAAAAVAVSGLTVTPASGANFASGNFVVYRVGARAGLTNAAAPVFLDAGCVLARPNGANAASTAIKANQKSTVDPSSYCIDFARMSRSKKTDGTEASLTFFAFGRDAVTWASIGRSYAPEKLTTAQLARIFTCDIKDWSEVGGQKGDIHVYANPNSAATYTFFLQTIGLTTQNVVDGCGSSLRLSQQNDGTTLKGDPQGITDYTVTKWAAQRNAATGIADLRGGAVLGKVNTEVPPTIPKAVGGRTLTVLNPAFATGAGTTQGRQFYSAVRSASAGEPWVSAIFGPTGFICTHQDDLLVPFGITPLGSDTSATAYCGQVS